MSENTTPAPMSSLVEQLAAAMGVEYKPSGIDLDAKGTEYIAQARRADAKARFFATCPDKYQTTDWDDPRLAPYRPQIDRVRGWVPTPGAKGILASGPTGRGKTRAVFGLYRRLSVDEGIDVRYWHASDWFGTLQQQVRYGTDDARGWIETVASRPIVIIDDLGQEAVQAGRSEWSQAWFFRFLDIRIGSALPLIITTNLTADTIAGTTKGIRADPLIRRLLDLCDVVKFDPISHASG